MSEITKEQFEALQAELNEAKEKADKIEANRNEILSEYKDFKKSAAEKADQERLELEQKAIDAAKKAGKFEEALKLERAQSERKQGDLLEVNNNLSEMILSSEDQVAVKSITGKFVGNDKFLEFAAKNLINHKFDENGNVVAEYKDLNGNVVASDFDNWLLWAQKDPDMKQHLAGSQAAGGGANGGGGVAATKKPSEMNDAERIQFKKDNPEGFKRAFSLT